MMRIFYSHGGRGNEGRVMVDGLSVGAALNGCGVSLYGTSVRILSPSISAKISSLAVAVPTPRAAC